VGVRATDCGRALRSVVTRVGGRDAVLDAIGEEFALAAGIESRVMKVPSTMQTASASSKVVLTVVLGPSFR